MMRFSEMNKHYDRHNEGICSVCGCTMWFRWKLVCNACRHEAIQELIKKVEPKPKPLLADNRVLDKALDLACEYLCESMFRILCHRRPGDRDMRQEEWKNRFINEAQMPEGGEGN